jgi:hypothetical protein
VSSATAPTPSDRPVVLDHATAARYLELGLDHLDREYPNHPGHLLTGPDDLRPPSELHPIFFGSYDWHSSVHMHWMLLRVLRHHPDLDDAAEVTASFDRRLTAANVAVEVAYLRDRPWFERPYGWAWLLTLAAELHDRRAGGPEAASDWAARTADTLAPLTEVVRELTLTWLRTAPGPQRGGTHGNSAFSCCLVWDAATTTEDTEVRETIADAADRWYPLGERAAPWLEPSSSDFLSPTLVLADLRRRVLPPDAFAAWLPGYLGDPAPLLDPADVPDRDDPQTVHLDGLNLSRTWNWSALANGVPPGHELAAVARTAAARHAAVALPAVLHGTYVGSHWLPSFALLAADGSTPR